jgi:hypothetical protein
MADVATNIERIYPEGTPPELYVFTTDTDPPRFATLEAKEHGYWRVDGPLFSKEALDVALAHCRDDADGRPLDDAEASALWPKAQPYSVDVSEVQFTGEYPDGPGRAALNLARLVLGG